jgi:hypothetical protein
MILRSQTAIQRRFAVCLVLSITLAACARTYVTPRDAERPDPVRAYDAIQSEPIMPAVVFVREFEFAPSAVRENASPLHRGINLMRHSSAEDRQEEIGRGAADSLSQATIRRLDKIGLEAVPVSRDSDFSPPDNTLLVTGRLIDVDEGNRLSRVTVGFGAGESQLESEVHVYRVMHKQRAEVLAFTTHADSGKMPGVVESFAVGWFIAAPITIISTFKDAASSGQKIYSTQVDHLAMETGEEVADYLSQYAAAQSWIPAEKARSVKLITD